jgi:hypothetical protein
MPTTHPRYTVTDTGELREMLDLARQRWPEIADRRQLLLRLATAGRDAIAPDVESADAQLRRDLQQAALRRAPELVDADELLADGAWR